jgi:tungstate transport system substrate-binding protein
MAAQETVAFRPADYARHAAPDCEAVDSVSRFPYVRGTLSKEIAMKRIVVLAAAVFALCAAVAAQAQEKVLMMATTTSTDNTGLLPVLADAFKKDVGVELRWTAVGTGKALELGKNCDVDVLLVHAPKAEKEFVEAGSGLGRTEVMFNDFVILGPKNDPAAIKGKTTSEALKAIAAAKAPFISRGDDSGTHKMELSLWKDAAMPAPDKEQWYVQAGQGMMATIVMAAERNGYTLTDRATYFTYEAKGNPALTVLVEGDKPLLNQYSVIVVNPEKCPKAKVDLAKALSDWMASDKGQKVIADFKTDGKQLFTPNAKK